MDVFSAQNCYITGPAGYVERQIFSGGSRTGVI